MTDNKDPKWFLKAVRDRAKVTEEKDLVQKIANAIGERRSRDLLDLVAGLESESGWSYVVSCLRNAASSKYPTPISFGGQETDVEPLKHREMIFALLSCVGLEPVAEETDSLLLSIEDAHSLAEASMHLNQKLIDLAIEQVKAGDTLFFSMTEDYNQWKQLKELLEQQRKKEIDSLSLASTKNKVNVTALWYTEYGRRALVDIGIKGYHTTKDELDTVLSVLQVSQDRRNDIRTNVKPTRITERPDDEIMKPQNQAYSKLLTSMINQDLEACRVLGSTHSVSVLDALLSQSIRQYKSSESSADYRLIIQCIDTHTSIRTLDSLATFQILVDLKEPRIFTPAIAALGNYFHESAAAILISLICSNRDQWIINPCLSSLENIMTKCPEANRALSAAVKAECPNAGPLKRLLRKTPKRNQWYYK